MSTPSLPLLPLLMLRMCVTDGGDDDYDDVCIKRE